MTTRRQQRVAEQVRHELSQLIEREIDDPRLAMISLTDATISPDLRNANVYVSSLQGEAGLFLLEAAQVQIAPSLAVPPVAWEYLMYAIALFGFHTFDPIPLAHRTAIEQMHAGLLVLDPQGAGD